MFQLWISKRKNLFCVLIKNRFVRSQTCFFSKEALFCLYQIQAKKKGEKAIMTEITVTPVWVEYRGLIIMSNEVFVRAGATLPFRKGEVTIIAGAVKDRQLPSKELKPLKLTVQGEKLPEDLLMATPNLRKHLQVLKETGGITFMFRLDGSLSVSPRESLSLVG
jgi:hypothetical protein